MLTSLYLRVRLYSTRKLKPLGTLRYHKSACQTLAFSRSLLGEIDDNAEKDDDDDEMSRVEKEERSRWLYAGAQDNRVSIWPLIAFDKT